MTRKAALESETTRPAGRGHTRPAPVVRWPGAARPRVLVVCTNSDLAGAPLHVMTLVQALRDRLEFLVVFGEDGPVAERLRQDGVAVSILGGMRSAISPFADLRSLMALVRTIRAFRPDLVHAHSSKAGMVARLAARATGVPVLFTVHGWSWAGMRGARRALVVGIETALCLLVPATRFLFVAEAVEQEGGRVLGLPRSAGQVVWNGVPDIGCSRVRPAEPLVILMPARVDRLKDHATLLAAFERLDVPAELWLCGEGTASADFKARVVRQAPRSCARIRLLGARSDMPRLLAQAHVLALVSHSEALPLSVIEAMSAGKAIVATDVGGVAELLMHGHSGLLVPRGDAAALARQLATLTCDGRRASLGAAARRRYEQEFHVDVMVRRVAETYRDIIGAPAVPAALDRPARVPATPAPAPAGSSPRVG